VQASVLRIDDDALSEWCRGHLCAAPVAESFRCGYLSLVIGLELADRRQVVVKIRPWENRLLGCFEIQRHLFVNGFPCPEPLLPPTPFGTHCATVERLVAGGADEPPSGRHPKPFAAALAKLVRIALPLASKVDLEPKPSWNRWDHREPGTWPIVEDADRDLNEVAGPHWLDHAGMVARSRLVDGTGPVVIGHGDWYPGNLRWDGCDLLVAHDWDSVIVDREATIVGYAAAELLGSSIEQSVAFLSAYEDASGRRFAAREIQQSYAAGLWLRSFMAKKQLAKGEEINSLSADEAGRLIILLGK
jgi:hypothetical protein